MWSPGGTSAGVRCAVVRVASFSTSYPLLRALQERHRRLAPLRVFCSPSRRLFTSTKRCDAPEHNSSSNNDGINYPDYFFDFQPNNEEAAAAPSLSSFPTQEPPPPPSPPPPPLSSSTELSAGERIEFQEYLEQVEDADLEFLAYAQGFSRAVADGENNNDSNNGKERADALAEAEHLLRGTSTRNINTPQRPFSSHPTQLPTPPFSPISVEDAAELMQDLAQEDAVAAELGAARPHHSDSLHDDYDADFNEAAAVEFGDDVEEDAKTLSALKGREMRMQNVADTVMAPLRIPDKEGNVTAPLVDGLNSILPSSLNIATARLLSSRSYLVQQDRLYLAPRTPPAAQLLPPLSTTTARTAAARQCCLVVFSANDLRVHDNQLLALASVCARSAAGNGAVPPTPVVAVCVLDYRTFAQPSVVGGFFRQSPQRAQFFLDTVAALRRKLEVELQVPLLLRCGRPEEHVPRLAAELGATDVFMTSQYAPHERRVQELMMQRLRKGVWVSREDVTDTCGTFMDASARDSDDHDDDDPLIAVVEHPTVQQHPYGEHPQIVKAAAAPPVAHSVWQTTLVHLDDLPTPLAAMKEGERWYHDDVTVSTIRPTAPYDKATEQLTKSPMSWQQSVLLPTREEREGRAPPSTLRGSLPTLEDLGYAEACSHGVDFAFEDVVATQSSHPTAGEEAAVARMQDWLTEGGMTSLLRYARYRRTNTKMYSQKLARVSPYIAVGALSPRKYYETLREYATANLRDGFAQQQFREGLLRLSRRDYWHWMGLRFGDRLFFSYGPHPEQTDEVPDWRHDPKVVQRWCNALTGIPFADAAMRELIGTGFVAHEGRQALAWLLTRGYGQDWRIGAEWMERCSLDYDPFICYGNFAYYSGLILDDFGEPIRNVHYLAHHHDQTGIYIKKWLPLLSKVPPVYIHRPHVLTARMQAMHNVYLGKNYPYPVKLWAGAQRTLSAEELTSYYAQGIQKGPGYAEALRYGAAVMPPEELHAGVSPAYLQQRMWASMLPASAFADVSDEGEEKLVMELGVVKSRGVEIGKHGISTMAMETSSAGVDRREGTVM